MLKIILVDKGGGIKEAMVGHKLGKKIDYKKFNK